MLHSKGFNKPKGFTVKCEPAAIFEGPLIYLVGN